MFTLHLIVVMFVPVCTLQFHQRPEEHFFSAVGEAYRACVELGDIWVRIGNSTGRTDVASHGKELLALADNLYHDLHQSLSLSVNTTASPGDRCYPHRVEDGLWSLHHLDAGQMGNIYRSFSELFFSGALTEQQTDDMYESGQGLNNCPMRFWMCMGTPSEFQNVFSHIPFGFPYSLLQHDMVERFLLYYFTQSAHVATRGFFMTPESSSIVDRTHEVAFSSAGPNNVVAALKWMLVFEEPETRTLWLAKATPRDWLRPGEAPIAVQHATTRYGRVCFALSAATAGAGGYVVRANVTLPASFGTAGSKPSGGVRLRIRAPVEHAGRMSGVTVGGKAWAGFDAATETVAFTSAELTPELVATGLRDVVVSFSAKSARAQLRRAPVDMGDRVLY